MARPARRQQTIDHIRGEICDAAARAFVRSGYEGATMADIAKEAGFAAPTLYSYFSGKQEIYDALVEKVTSEALASFEEPTPAGLTLAQHLEMVLQRQLAWIAGRWEQLAALSEIGGSKAREAEFVGRYCELARRVLEQHPEAFELAGVDLDDAAFLFWAINNAFHVRHLKFGMCSADLDARRVVAVFFGACEGMRTYDRQG